MTFSMTPDARLRALYPNESDAEIQERLDEMVGWVAYHASCTAATGFSNGSPEAALVRNLVRRALKYEKSSDDGTVMNRTAGQFSRTIDTRRPTSPTPFAPDQQVVLKSLCRVGGAVARPAYSVPLRHGPSVDVPYLPAAPQVDEGHENYDDLGNLEDLATLIQNNLI